jgi:tyrosine-specific transport protein
MLKIDSKVLGGTLLVAGTTIGGAVLALPVSTGLAGFFPSLSLFFVCWVMMIFSALLFLEVNLAFKGDVNLITMVNKTLGPIGEMFAWVVYLFLLYSLTTAYIAGSGALCLEVINEIFDQELPGWLGPLPVLFIFGAFVYRGTSAVDGMNRILMLGLVLSFIALIGCTVPFVELQRLEHCDWQFVPLATSVIATAYGFHIIIPSLVIYLDRDVTKLRQTIFLGSAIPMLAYAIWEFFCLGAIPIEGENGLQAAYQIGLPATHSLRYILQNPWITLGARFFEFFAITTSFLGVSLSLTDFFADGLGIRKSRLGRLLLMAMTFIPPLLITWTYPRAFLSALEYAGAFGVLVLLAIFPALMAWSGRYKKHLESPYRAPGGKTALIVLIIYSLIVIGIEIGKKLGAF